MSVLPVLGGWEANGGIFQKLYLNNAYGQYGSTAGWTMTSGTAAVQPTYYGRPPSVSSAFWGGTSAASSMYQRFSVADFPFTMPLDLIDAGRLQIRIEWWGGTYEQTPNDDVKLSIRCRNAATTLLTTETSGYRDPKPGGTLYTNNWWTKYIETFPVAANTRYLDVVLDFRRNNGTNNDASVSIVEISTLAPA